MKNKKQEPIDVMTQIAAETRKNLGVPFQIVDDSGQVTFDSEKFLKNAKVRIKCRCGTTFIALVPESLAKTVQTHQCTQCRRVFKTKLGDKGWQIQAVMQ